MTSIHPIKEVIETADADGITARFTVHANLIDKTTKLKGKPKALLINPSYLGSGTTLVKGYEVTTQGAGNGGRRYQWFRTYEAALAYTMKWAANRFRVIEE